MGKKSAKKPHRTKDFNRAADRMGRAAKARSKAKEPKREFEQPELPGTPPATPPDGPLQFRVGSDRGKCSDKSKGSSMGKNREILVVLSRAFSGRHPEVAVMLDKPVKVRSIEGDRQEQCRLVRYSGSVGKDGVTVKATISTGADGHKWLGRLVTVASMQPELPLEEKSESEAEPEPVGASA